MTKLNNQTLFDTVARHLLKQGKRSGETQEDGSFACMYRAPDGCKCAAGAILPDDKYDPAMEGCNVYSNQEFWNSLVEELHLLSHLQSVHDYDPGEFFMDDHNERGLAKDQPNLIALWRTRLKAVAKRYDLDHSVLDEPIPA